MKPDFSLKQTWVTLILFAVITPTAIMMAWYYQNSYKSQLNSALTIERHANEQIRNKIESEVDRYKTLLKNKSDPISFLLEQNDNPVALTNINRLLTKITERESGIREVAVLSGQSDIIAFIDSNIGVTGEHLLSTEEKRSARIHLGLDENYDYPEVVIPSFGRTYIGAPEKHEYFFTFKMAVPVGKPAKGVLLALIDVEKLWPTDAFTDHGLGAGKNLDYILDRRGTLLTKIKDSDYFKPGDLMTHLAIARTALINTEWQTDTPYTGVSNETVFGTITNIPSLNWTLVSEVIAAKVTQPIWEQLLNIILLTLFGLILFTWLVLYLASRTLKPIHQTIDAIDNVAKGNYHLTLQSCGIRELDTMTAGFNSMAVERRQIEEQQHLEHTRLMNILDAIPDGVYIVSQEFDIEYINPVIEKEFGPVEGRKCYEYFHDLTASCSWCKNVDVFAGKSVDWEWYSSKNDRYYDLFDTPFKNNDGSISKFEIFHDITARKLAEEELQKLSKAVESSSSGVMITDPDGSIEYINPKFTETTGYSKEEVIGENPRILQSGETPETIYVDLWDTILAGGEWKGELHNRKKSGDFYWNRASISSVKDATGNITHFVAIQDDVTYAYEMSEQLSFQASHDALTGLINRREFERRAERLLSTIKHDKAEHALCFLDLDQFKIVNDSCGHIAGDELLRQLGHILLDVVRQRDTLARLGGDEFGILMEHCSLEHAKRTAAALKEAVQDYQLIWEGQSFRVGVSIGLVAITEATPNLTELLKGADAACYMAKELGRNRIHVYQAEDVDLAQRHGEMQWATRIQQALEEDRFCLYAQAIVPLDGSTDKHYELLIRMIDTKGKIIPPGAFLPAAERYNLMEKLDRLVIERTYTLLADNPDFLEQIQFISINLSGQSLADNNFEEFVVEQFESTKVPPGKICFEITETAAISNLSTANVFITRMKSLGCRFALDDFGSGLSSFGYLKTLPVDYLKIDGMFVKDIVDDPIDHAMVKSINEIGHVMGMQTIAEFVENDEIKGMLREIGVNYAQGYGIEKPGSFDELFGQYNGGPGRKEES